MKISRFEDIEIWKRARSLTKGIYNITSRRNFEKDWGLKDQIRRACVSITSNVAEGFDSGFKNEFVRFLLMAKRSASEIQNQLYVALDQEYIDEPEFDRFYKETEEIRKMISGFIKYLRSSDHK